MTHSPAPMFSQEFGIAVAAIITGGDDYGTYPPDPPARMLKGWGIRDEPTARETIEGLLGSPRQGDALVFDRVRAVHLARAAAGARYLTQDDSWQLVQRACKDIQRGCDSWSDVGAAYLRAKNAWLAERGLDTADGTEQNVQRLEGSTWTTVPFGIPLDEEAAHPPSPWESAQSAMAQNARDEAERAAHKSMWRFLHKALPKWMLPLIPGYSKDSALVVYRKWFEKYVWRVVSGALFSLFMMGVVAAVLVGLALVVVFSVWTSL